MAGVAIITEACIDVKDRACVDVCPVQCIYEFDAVNERPVLRSRGGRRDDREQPCAGARHDRHVRRQHAVRAHRRVHLVHRLLPARRVPGRGDLLRGARPRRERRAPPTTPTMPTRGTTTRSSSPTMGASLPTGVAPPPRAAGNGRWAPGAAPSGRSRAPGARSSTSDHAHTRYSTSSSSSLRAHNGTYRPGHGLALAPGAVRRRLAQDLPRAPRRGPGTGGRPPRASRPGRPRVGERDLRRRGTVRAPGVISADGLTVSGTHPGDGSFVGDREWIPDKQWYFGSRRCSRPRRHVTH